MINALRLVSVQRGYDPRGFALVGFGGAGPVHVNRLAAETEIATVIIPMSPGIFSAMGLLVTDLKHDYSSTLTRPASGLDVDEVEQVFQDLEQRGREALRREKVAEDKVECVRSRTCAKSSRGTSSESRYRGALSATAQSTRRQSGFTKSAIGPTGSARRRNRSKS